MSTVAAEQALAQSIVERGAALLRIPENQWFDRKSARIGARELADKLIGFANAEGGTVAVGLWKNAGRESTTPQLHIGPLGSRLLSVSRSRRSPVKHASLIASMPMGTWIGC